MLFFFVVDTSLPSSASLLKSLLKALLNKKLPPRQPLTVVHLVTLNVTRNFQMQMPHRTEATHKNKSEQKPNDTALRQIAKIELAILVKRQTKPCGTQCAKIERRTEATKRKIKKTD